MLYDLMLNDLEPEIEVSENRVIEYAKNRMEANPDEILDWNFNIDTMNINQAINIINSFNEEVFPVEKHLIEILNENNGSLITDWGVFGNEEDKTVVLTEEINECNDLLKDYRHRIDLILNASEYTKCDVCQKIYPVEDTIIDDEGEIICYKCQKEL